MTHREYRGFSSSHCHVVFAVGMWWSQGLRNRQKDGNDWFFLNTNFLPPKPYCKLKGHPNSSHQMSLTMCTVIKLSHLLAWHLAGGVPHDYSALPLPLDLLHCFPGLSSLFVIPHTAPLLQTIYPSPPNMHLIISSMKARALVYLLQCIRCFE